MIRVHRPLCRLRRQPGPARFRPARRADNGLHRGRGPEGRPILVVDDDDFGRETLGRILEVAGYRVQRAADGAAALRCLGRDPLPGLIVLDLLMPLIDGWEFCAQRRRDPRLAGIPILVVSAADGAALGQNIDGVVGRFEKPVVVPELLAVIRRYCRPG